ncbi:MAG: Nramp family divalent metal transporter [Planctomycetaceae bacterium]|nr:Nramp family divalent metal transporter [Planctomycetaceae bacterium]
MIVTGAVIGSGELVLTTSLGAAAGWSLLWWLVLSCWCKSLVQAEIARYTIVSGDTYLRALNRLPGRIGRVSWPICLSLLAYIPITMGLGGILGGAGQSLSFFASLADITIDGKVCAGIIAVVSSIILGTGSYLWLERVMLPLVLIFTLTTLICSIAMQFTEFHTSLDDVVGGMSPDFPLFVSYAALALAAYGYTGTTSGDITAYTYWCIEKGYPSYVGSDRSAPEWESHARGWMKVLHTDVWLALIIVTCATIPYYVLGAGVLNQMGVVPQGNSETISTLSNIFTQTLGPWAVWIFSIGAFLILFSTVLSGMGANGRVFPDYLVELQLIDRSNLALRKAIIRWYLAALPIITFLIFLFSPSFVILIMIGALTSAIFLPIQAGATIWLQSRQMDPRIRPRALTRAVLWAIFLFELAMAGLVIWFVVLAPLRN